MTTLNHKNKFYTILFTIKNAAENYYCLLFYPYGKGKYTFYKWETLEKNIL